MTAKVELNRLQLVERLKDAEIYCPDGSLNSIIPLCAQKEIITVKAIIDIISINDAERQSPITAKYAERINQDAKQLFAILLRIKKERDIQSFLDEHIGDKDLPFQWRKREDGQYDLYRKSDGGPVKTSRKWESRDLITFAKKQYLIVSPFFKPMDHHELDDFAVLPFVYEGTRKDGGNSTVFRVKLHNSHHSFWQAAENPDNEPFIAIKRLFSIDKKVFEREVSNLKEISLKKPKPHPHIIQLLATYEHRNQYHLMFPYAESNLRKYWDSKPKPPFDKTTLLWNLRQIKGISSALLYLHEFRVKGPLSVMNGNQIQNGGAKWSISDGEEKFGRHGDIKPENMLWFRRMPGNDDPLGILQLADFGSARFHGRDSRSRTNAGKVPYSPVYEPPECRLGKPVSRTYDFWSFGCVLLEYVTWLLKGSKAVYEFSNARRQGIVINDGNFFTLKDEIEDGQKKLTAVVRQQVIDWVNGLHAHPNASRLIHDLLDLTMERLLVVDAQKRARADTVDRELGKLLVKAAKDNRYLLDPLPFPQSKIQSARDMQKRSQGIQIKV